jgi:hypothetical protein
VSTTSWRRLVPHAVSPGGWLYCCGDDKVKGEPFALWANVGGNAVVLCRHHLDIWLDNADDDPGLEPDELVFLTP